MPNTSPRTKSTWPTWSSEYSKQEESDIVLEGTCTFSWISRTNDRCSSLSSLGRHTRSTSLRVDCGVKVQRVRLERRPVQVAGWNLSRYCPVAIGKELVPKDMVVLPISQLDTCSITRTPFNAVLITSLLCILVFIFSRALTTRRGVKCIHTDLLIEVPQHCTVGQPYLNTS